MVPRHGVFHPSGGMPPPRHHYFNLRVPSGTSVDAVIDAAEAIVPPSELYSVQHMGGLEFQI